MHKCIILVGNYNIMVRTGSIHYHLYWRMLKKYYTSRIPSYGKSVQ